jgi:hypothetical protein
MVSLSSLDDLDPIKLGVDEEALRKWGKKCGGCICPEVKGYRVGDSILVRIGAPLELRENIAFERRENLLILLGATQDESQEGESLNFINYICPVRVPEEYDLDSMKWGCGQDYMPHIRILIPKKTNV